MTIFATGNSGTIGRHLSTDVKPILLDLRVPGQGSHFTDFSKKDSLLHLAGIVGTGIVEADLDTSYKVNVLGTLRLAKYFLEGAGRKFLYVSTSHVYAPSSQLLSEESEIEAQNSYAEQKLETELRLLELFERDLTKLCIVRVFSVLDWDAAPFTLGGAIAKLSDENSEFNLCNGDDVRDFLTPRSIANILEKLLEEHSLPTIINLCSGVGIKVAVAARTMLAGSGYEIPEHRILPGNSSNPYIVGNNSKLTKLFPNMDLSWSPSIRI